MTGNLIYFSLCLYIYLIFSKSLQSLLILICSLSLLSVEKSSLVAHLYFLLIIDKLIFF